MIAPKRYGRGIRVIVEDRPYLLHRLAKIIGMESQELRRNWEALGRPPVVKELSMLTAPRERKVNSPIAVIVPGIGWCDSIRGAARRLGVPYSSLYYLVSKHGPILTSEHLDEIGGLPTPKKTGRRPISSEWDSFSDEDRSYRLNLIP
jgi:hypothetical protein